MSDAAPTQQAPTGQEPPPSSQAQRGLYSSGLKLEAADGVPADFVGKDIKEIVQMAEAYKQAALSPPPNAFRQQEPPQYRAASSFPAAPDPQLMYSNPQEYQRQQDAWNDHRAEQRLNAAAAPIVQSLANNAKWQSKADPEYAEVWQKYGHEIELLAQRAGQPITQREGWDMFAQLVRGNHWREFVDQRAQQLVASGGFGTERGAASGAPPAENIDPISRLFATDTAWTRKARAEGLTEDAVRAYCRQRGQSPADYANDILKGNVITAGAA